MCRASIILSWQKYACHDKTFVTTNICLSWQRFCRDKHNFVVTKVLSQQAYFCHIQKMCFVTMNTCLSQQMHVCHYKLLSRQKWNLWQLPPVILPDASIGAVLGGGGGGWIWECGCESGDILVQMNPFFFILLFQNVVASVCTRIHCTVKKLPSQKPTCFFSFPPFGYLGVWSRACTHSVLSLTSVLTRKRN